MYMNEYQDQTAFANQEPFLENVSLPEKPVTPEPEPDPEDAAAVESAKRKKKMIVIGGVITSVFILLIVLGLALLAPRNTPTDSDPIDIIIPKEKTEAITRTERELEVLKDRLDEIDPTREYLTVPPVNYELRLE